MKFRVSPVLALMIPMIAMADSVPRASMELKLRPYELKMRDYNFPSGLRVVFQADNSQPVVNVSSVIDHGSADEPPGLEGMAHLIEHLNFRAKHKDAQGNPLPPIWDIISQIGARSFNATTSNDRTNYLTTVPKENLVPLLRIESLRLKNAVAGVTDEEIRTEREVVRNELRASMENGPRQGVSYLYEMLFPKGHPYHRDTIGTNDSLNNITLKDVEDYCKKYYTPSETTILISGDIDLEKASTYLQEFGIDQLAAADDPKGERLALIEPKIRVSGPAPEPPTPAKPVEVKGEIEDVPVVNNMVEKPTILIGWSLPAGWREHDPMMEMVANQTRIAIQQSLNPAWVYSEYNSSKQTDVGCWASPGKYASELLCAFEIDDKKDAAKKVEIALNGLVTIWTTDEAWRRFQNYIYSYSKQMQMSNVFNSVDSLTDVFGRGNVVSEFIHQTGDVAYYSRSFEWINKVNPDTARKFAEKYLQRGRAAAVIVVPYEEGQADVESKSAAYAGTRGEDKAKSIFTDEQLTPENIAKAARVPDISKISETKLANGMRTIVMPHGSAPLVQANLVFNGGANSSNLDLKKLTFAAGMWREDSTLQSLSIAGEDYFDFGSLRTEFFVQGSAGNVPDAMFLMRDRMDKLIPYTDGKISFVKSQKKAILTWMKDPDLWASRIASERLFPGHRSSARLTHTDLEEMNKWSTSVTSDVFATVMRPENATLYVVGNVDVAETNKAIKTYWDGWSGWGKKPEAWQAPTTVMEPSPTPPARQVVLFNRDNQSQAHVTARCQLPELNAQDYQTALVMGDYLDAILWLALREQTGASYGAGAGVSAAQGGGSQLYQGVSTLQNNQIALAIKSFTQPLEQMKAGKIDERTWKVMKMNYAQSTVLQQVTSSAMLNRLKSYDLWGWGIKDLPSEPKRIASADHTAVPRLLERCVGHEVITVVGPVEVYKPLLDAAGIKWEVYDWKQATKDYKLASGLKVEEEKDDKKDEKKKK